ncbi:hypothetical protein GSI_15583 [Ganoderma sinense ZZ0214-1]|uniref:Uncharacterized protein n=1 Tax=Ganoderma sinense ZZ0214-1 TaxID=1077348 RepID=A0A2G8RMZ4_9APHY|nr:hypothetical protein GSI_15583 [Ganoderma sinense ZZ0214-1]
MTFTQFLDARNKPDEHLRRLTFLNMLSLDLSNPKEAATVALEPLFELINRAASNFTSLKVCEAEDLLKIYPPLVAAIAKLTTLKTLGLVFTGVHCATLLMTLQSSLTVATICFKFGVHPSEFEFDFIPDTDKDPTILLQGSQSTLKSLCISFPAPFLDGPHWQGHYDKDYITAFPNLRSLTTAEREECEEDSSYWDERRDMAMEYQAEHGTWRSLQYYEGSMLVLWIWALKCRIPSITLTFEQHFGVDPILLSSIMLDVRPSRLSVRLPGASWLLDDAVRGVLSLEGRLQVLELRILFHALENDDTVSAGHILDLLVDVAQASSVPTFRLILDLTWLGTLRRRSGGAGEGLPVMPFEVYLHDMDVDVYADSLFASVMSLTKMPAIPTLNLDILFYIMSFSNRKTLLCMMLTSRDLHHGGIKHLLRKTPSIWNTRKFRSFLSFCEARGDAVETAYRMHYLRGLEIELDSPGSFFNSGKYNAVERKLGPTSQSLAHLLTSTIRVYAHNFTRLLFPNCDGLLSADPHLSVAIASLTTLTYLNLGDATKRSFGLLRSLQSRLVEANIGMNIDLIDPPEGDITAMLRNSEPSMTILSLYHTSNPTGAACYPQLHTLSLCHLDAPTTRHYVTTFPNLQVLQARQCLAGFSEDPDEWLQYRNSNVYQQAQGGSWRALRAYVGSILFLYLFGLGCHVTYVHVYAEDEYETIDFGQLRDIVADTSPEHFVVDIVEISYTLDRGEDVMVLFEDAGFRAVKTFVLNLSLCRNDKNMDVEALLECIFIGICSSPALVGFELALTWSSLKYRPGNIIDVDSTGKKTRPKLSRAEKFLEGLDANSVADRLLRDSKSLQAVRVTLGTETVERGPVDIFFDEETLERRNRE